MHFSRAARGRLPELVFVAVASLYFATAWAKGPAVNWNGQTSDYYALLTDAFLAGQTNLLVQPSAELLALPDPYDSVANARFRLHDASLYHGKYYLYFGPTPAIVLFLPYKVLTGSHLPTRIAVALFSTIGYACSCALFFLLAKRERWDFPPWFGATAVLSLGTATAVSALLTRPSFYEVAIGAAYCFVMAGFLLTAHSLGEDSPRPAWLIGAGLCFGLAAGCRPNSTLIAILMVVLVGWRTRSRNSLVLAFAAPVVLCGMLLAAYNYARFQNPFDFGTQYTLLLHRSDLGEHFGLRARNLLPSLNLLVFYPFRQSKYDFSLGLLSTPIAILGLFTPCILWYGRIRDHVKLGSTRFTIYSVYVSALVMLTLLAFLGFVAGRYSLDFAPEFVLVSWCLLAGGWQAAGGSAEGRRIWFQIAVVVATLYSAFWDIWICRLRYSR